MSLRINQSKSMLNFYNRDNVGAQNLTTRNFESKIDLGKEIEKQKSFKSKFLYNIQKRFEVEKSK